MAVASHVTQLASSIGGRDGVRPSTTDLNVPVMWALRCQVTEPGRPVAVVAGGPSGPNKINEAPAERGDVVILSHTGFGRRQRASWRG
jgi:hypothetical protein